MKPLGRPDAETEGESDATSDVFGSYGKHRGAGTVTKRAKGDKTKTSEEPECQTPFERRAAMTQDQAGGRLWAQYLKRVFNIDIETCKECGGSVQVIACIEDSVVIKKILAHLMDKALSAEPHQLPKNRAPHQAGLFD